MVSQMESQHADANEELLLELKSKNTTRSVKDFSPEGISLESDLEGDAERRVQRHVLRYTPRRKRQTNPFSPASRSMIGAPVSRNISTSGQTIWSKK